MCVRIGFRFGFRFLGGIVFRRAAVGLSFSFARCRRRRRRGDRRRRRRRFSWRRHRAKPCTGTPGTSTVNSSSWPTCVEGRLVAQKALRNRRKKRERAPSPLPQLLLSPHLLVEHLVRVLDVARGRAARHLPQRLAKGRVVELGPVELERERAQQLGHFVEEGGGVVSVVWFRAWVCVSVSEWCEGAL